MTNEPKLATFQGLIFALQHYWAEHGCVILQPYDMEMGAGTFHTATFLRSIGPEPWNAAYVQPSRRPTDGRYGETSRYTIYGSLKITGNHRHLAPGGWAGKCG